MTTDKTSLFMKLAKLEAESGSYNSESGLTADAFTRSYNEVAKLFKNPLGLCFAFDSQDDAVNFVAATGAHKELTTVGNIFVPILKAERIEEFSHVQTNMVLVVLPEGKGGEFVSTRLKSLAENGHGRMVKSFGAPPLHDPDDPKVRWGKGPVGLG